MPLSLAGMQALKRVLALPESQQLEIFRTLAYRTHSPESMPTVAEVRDQRFRAGVACPHCKSTRIHRHGKYRYENKGGASLPDRWRYRCLDCRKTFNDYTASPFAGTHHPDKWLGFIACVCRATSVRAAAADLAISIPTAFYWRHKLLAALSKLGDQPLEGIVEVDETYVLESCKGSRTITRPGRHHGGTATRRGISREQVCILVARDRSKHTVARVVGFGKPGWQDLDLALGTAFGSKQPLCTDAHPAYAKFAHARGLHHEMLNASKNEIRRGVYHLNHVNACHSRLKKLRAFNGVSTKYMHHYLSWFIRYDGAGQQSLNARISAFVLEAMSAPVPVRTWRLTA